MVGKSQIKRNKIKKNKNITKSTPAKSCRFCRRRYNPSTLAKAIELVTSKTMKLRDASRRYGIPLATLHDKINGKHLLKVGSPTRLSYDYEKLLVHALINLAEWGFGLSRRQICDVVEFFLKNTKQSKLFKSGRPGAYWFKGFMRRNPQLSVRVAENLPLERTMALNKYVVDHFYDLVATYYEQLDLSNSPNNIWNVDETGFSCSKGRRQIICRKGSKNPHSLCGNNQKTTFTVQGCCNAAGEFLPPYIIYKAKNLYKDWCNGPFMYNTSQSGWMEESTFFEWMDRMFIPRVSKIVGPIILFLDGHNSHISVRIIDLAIKNNITIICIPPHTSHALQPLDVGVYGPVKAAWREIVEVFFRKSNAKIIDKHDFSGLIAQLYEKAFHMSHAKGGKKILFCHLCFILIIFIIIRIQKNWYLPI
jgi:hypothetical protein